MTEEDVLAEYDPCDDSNRTYNKYSLYYGFKGNFTRSQARRLNSAVCMDEVDYDEVTAERTRHESRRLLSLIITV